ncbi:adaptin ear-binding coat-associated protein 2-like [Styela clava]
MAGEYERILTVKPEVLVYRIPPRSTNRGYRAADWGLDKPSWTGRMRIIATGNKVVVKLEDRNGELFAQAPIDSYPGMSVESVTDSSRYFVLKIADGSGRTAYIGIGFADRGDAFDFNVTLQDHFNSVKKDKEIEQNVNTQPALDLQLKEGQTFKINLGGKLGSKTQGSARPRTNAPLSGGGLLLPPPPGGVAAPKPQTSYQQPAASSVSADLLGMNASNSQPQASNPFGQSDWGEFASAQSNPTNNTNSDPGWVQF